MYIVATFASYLKGEYDISMYMYIYNAINNMFSCFLSISLFMCMFDIYCMHSMQFILSYSVSARRL